MNSTPITAEQRHALGEIVEKGNIVNVDDRTYLMVQVTPLMVDFLKAIKLEGRENGFTGSQAESFKTPPDAAAPEDDLA